MRISIIVPVYNAENCVQKCVNSLLKQSITDYELLLIDDGSTDKSLDICEKIAAMNPRVKVIHQENAGVSAARNTGLEHVCGEYIAFVDSDDLVAPDYLECLLKGMEKEHVILSMCGHERIYNYDNRFLPSFQDKHELMQAQQCAKRILTDNFPVAVWGALFHKALIGDIRFPVGIRNNEDKQFLFLYLLKNENGIVASSVSKLYGYMVREGSATRRAWNGSVDVVTVADLIRYETVKIHPEWDDKAKKACMKARFDVLKSVVRSEPSEYGDRVYEKLKKEIIRFGYPKTGNHRLRIEYLMLRFGKKSYKILIDTYYRVFTEKKRFRLNEKKIRQG